MKARRSSPDASHAKHGVRRGGRVRPEPGDHGRERMRSGDGMAKGSASWVGKSIGRLPSLTQRQGANLPLRTPERNARLAGSGKRRRGSSTNSTGSWQALEGGRVFVPIGLSKRSDEGREAKKEPFLPQKTRRKSILGHSRFLEVTVDYSKKKCYKFYSRDTF